MGDGHKGAREKHGDKVTEKPASPTRVTLGDSASKDFDFGGAVNPSVRAGRDAEDAQLAYMVRVLVEHIDGQPANIAAFRRVGGVKIALELLGGSVNGTGDVSIGKGATGLGGSSSTTGQALGASIDLKEEMTLKEATRYLNAVQQQALLLLQVMVTGTLEAQIPANPDYYFFCSSTSAVISFL